MVARGLTTAILMLGFVAAAHAGANSPARVRAFARLPDWTGVWQSTVWLADESGRPPGGIAQVSAESQLRRPPPYNNEWAANYQAAVNAAHAAKALRVRRELSGADGVTKDVSGCDTVARASSTPVAWSSLAPSAMLSDRAHFTERLRLVDEVNLVDQLTIEDPMMSHMLPYDCEENDRNPENEGKIVIAPR